MATAIYVRVSSVSQNTASQTRAINTWLRNHGHEDVVRFEDKATGSNMDRAGFQALEAAIFNGEVSTVVCYKLDRLCRSLRDGVDLIHRWTEQGVRIVSVTQQLDLSGAVGRMVASVLLGLAEIEREHIRERQAAGIAVAKAEGKFLGRKPGTTKAKPKRAVQLRAKGLKDREIATALGVSRRTVQRYLAAV